MAVVPQIQPRILVRSVPFGAQVTYVAHITPAAGTLTAVFDVSRVVCDPNQLQAGVIDSLPTVGPTLDAFVVQDHIGTLDVLVAVDAGASFYSILAAPIAIAALIPVQINGLRTPGRYIKLVYTNTSGANSSGDFGSYMRSN
jgi:hypothetical protein